MNKEIIRHLESQYEVYATILQKSSFKDVIEQLMQENPDCFNFDIGNITNLFDDEDISNFKKAQKDIKLNTTFEKAKKLFWNERLLISDIVDDIKDSIIEIKRVIDSKKEIMYNQAIFIEHDHLPSSHFCGYSNGTYPIIQNPIYIYIY